MNLTEQRIYFPVNTDIYGKIISFLSVNDINNLRSVNSQLRVCTRQQQCYLTRRIYNKAQSQTLIWGLDKSKFYREIPFLKSILSSVKQFTFKISFICFYEGQTIVVQDKIMPFGPFQLTGIYNHYSDSCYFFKVTGSFINKEDFLYPQLDGTYVYEDGYLKSYKNPFASARQVDSFINSHFSNKDYILPNEKLMNIYERLKNINPKEGLNISSGYGSLKTVYSFGRKSGRQIAHKLSGQYHEIEVNSYEKGHTIYELDISTFEYIPNFPNYKHEDLLQLTASTPDIYRVHTVTVSTEPGILCKYIPSELKSSDVRYPDRMCIESGKSYKFFLIDPKFENIQFKKVWTLSSLIKISELKVQTFRIPHGTSISSCNTISPTLSLRRDYSDISKTIIQYQWNYHIDYKYNEKQINAWYDNFELGNSVASEIYKHLSLRPYHGVKRFVSVPDKLVVYYRTNGYINFIVDCRNDIHERILNHDYHYNFDNHLKIFNDKGQSLLTYKEYMKTNGTDNYNKYLKSMKYTF